MSVYTGILRALPDGEVRLGQSKRRDKEHSTLLHLLSNDSYIATHFCMNLKVGFSVTIIIYSFIGNAYGINLASIYST